MAKTWRKALVVSALLCGAAAHPHHASPDEIDPSAVSWQHFRSMHTFISCPREQPIDTMLRLHIYFQIFVWAILFPTGMVLGITRSRWHVPVQSLGTVLTLAGYFLGHHHGGREFPETAHGLFASFVLYYLVAQAAMGIFLKLHLKWGEDRVRPIVVKVHGVLGKSYPVIGWVQMVLGGIALLGMCFGDHLGERAWRSQSFPSAHYRHLGQCLAHFIMGSSFIGQSIIVSVYDTALDSICSLWYSVASDAALRGCVARQEGDQSRISRLMGPSSYSDPCGRSDTIWPR
jgi:hypothetical protein